MKKQLLIFALFLFAGLASAVGQVAPRSFVAGILEGGPLTPVPGVPYTYDVTITPPTGNTFQWFVTQNFDFLQARDDVSFRELIGGDFLDAGTIDLVTGLGVDSTLSLTWKSFEYDPAAPIFVAIYVVNADGTCTSENLRVFKIEPMHAFTLDIANLGFPDDYGANIEVCISDIQSAVYNPVGNVVDYDYGQNILEYEVVAANWFDYWDLEVQLSGLAAGQTAEVVWSYTSDFSGTLHLMTEATGTYTSGQSIHPGGNALPGGSVGPAGERIYIRVTVSHNDFEGIADVQLSLAVNGLMPGGEDLSHVTGLADSFHDIALQTIAARPGVASPLQMLND